MVLIVALLWLSVRWARLYDECYCLVLLLLPCVYVRVRVCMLVYVCMRIFWLSTHDVLLWISDMLSTSCLFIVSVTTSCML